VHVYVVWLRFHLAASVQLLFVTWLMLKSGRMVSFGQVQESLKIVPRFCRDPNFQPHLLHESGYHIRKLPSTAETTVSIIISCEYASSFAH
jgi:hypothetical protein